MEDMHWEGERWVYGLQILACAIVLYARNRAAPPKLALNVVDKVIASFTGFQWRFLLVFLLASVADALQCVYSEALYESYGMKRNEIAILVALGYSSSLFLGTFVAAAADSIGRKQTCMLYGVFQVIGCLAKQSSDFRMLCFAHVCLGIATSLLFSSFEAWMVAEHDKMGFRQEWLSETFWLMSFNGGIVATGSGALANFMNGWQGSTGSAPLIAAAVTAVLSTVAVSRAFNENIGIASSSVWRPLVHAVQSLNDRKVLCLGWAQVCFDFSIIVFWFLWSPTLVADGREVHSGLIFTRLMASMMLGTTIASYLLNGPYYLCPERFLPYVLLMGGFSLFLPAYDHQEVRVLLSCFCVFHLCVGIALPSLARLRSIYIPNDRRAAVMSICRVPVYVAAIVILIRGGRLIFLDNSTIFSTAILGLLSGAGSIFYIHRRRGVAHESPLTARP